LFGRQDLQFFLSMQWHRKRAHERSRGKKLAHDESPFRQASTSSEFNSEPPA
jgi:hypothetical protein